MLRFMQQQRHKACEATKAPENGHIGIRDCPSQKNGKISSSAEVHLHQCRRKDLEAIVQQESYDRVAIKETWWEDPQNWKDVMDGYKLFRWDRQGKIGHGVALCVRDYFGCLELNDGRAKANNVDVVVEVCYRPPRWDEGSDRMF